MTNTEEHTGALRLATGEVELWRADLDANPAALEYWRSLLDEAELARAARFYFEEDRRHYIAARGTLRELLGDYLAIRPQAVRFEYLASGKPQLAEPTTDLKFNVSHSRECGLFAFTRGREVGVDVELGARLGDDLAALTRRVFSGRERVRWLLRPEDERRAAFLDVWTRKEALLKASGRGIVDGMQDVETPALRSSSPAIVSGGPARPGEAWTLWDVREFAGCAAAVALEGTAPAGMRLQGERTPAATGARPEQNPLAKTSV